MSNNKKFNPEILGFYAIVIVLVIIVSLSVVEGGKWIYNKVKDDDEIAEVEYGAFYEFIGDIPSISYSGVFSPIESNTQGYYVITLDLDDDYNCESCGDMEEQILAFLQAYVDDERKNEYPEKPLLYIMNLNDSDNDKILGSANNGVISSFENEDNGYGVNDLKIDENFPISILFINGKSQPVEITNEPTELSTLLTNLTDVVYAYNCEDWDACEEE